MVTFISAAGLHDLAVKGMARGKGISSGPTHFDVRIGLFGSGREYQYEPCPDG
jgi:hypothetical protein